jgi:hypothetical protein
MISTENVVSAPGFSIDFKTNVMRVEQIPTAEFQRFVYQNAREGFIRPGLHVCRPYQEIRHASNIDKTEYRISRAGTIPFV